MGGRKRENISFGRPSELYSGSPDDAWFMRGQSFVREGVLVAYLSATTLKEASIRSLLKTLA